MSEHGLEDRAAALRAAFDRTFADPRPEPAPGGAALLQIRAGGMSCALELAAIARVRAGVPITPLPSRAPHLLGLAGLRGGIVPVYDLGALLRQPATPSPRWLVLAAAAPVAFAFELMERHVQVAREEFAPRGDAQASWPHVREVARIAGRLCPVVHLASVLEEIEE